VLALSYERKVRQLMTDLGQGKLCVDIEQAGIERLTEMFADLESRRDSIVEELDRRVKRETDAVLAQFDRVVSTLLPAPTPGSAATVSSF
jgi:polysaccharide pyruvyl transferase WcaK-like protein